MRGPETSAVHVGSANSRPSPARCALTAPTTGTESAEVERQDKKCAETHRGSWVFCTGLDGMTRNMLRLMADRGCFARVLVIPSTEFRCLRPRNIAWTLQILSSTLKAPASSYESLYK